MRQRRLSIIFQVCFWFLIIMLQVAMASNFLPFNVALMFAGVNMILGMAAFYLNSLWIFPNFFEKRRFVLYLVLNVVLLGMLSHIFFMADAYIFVNYTTKPFPDHLPRMIPYFRIFSMLIFIVFISLIFSLIRKVQDQEGKEKQLSKEKSDTEIQLLKAQINPHFIFNSMNNIYSLAYSKSDQAPEAILKLSEMLRYVYYDCNRDEVTLGAELEYIRNYMAFQQMKSPHEQSIVLEADGIDENFRIAPMLFIPFVENSFKYSKIEELQDARVEIKLTTEDNKLCFRITNTHPENGKSPGSGMGIENVRSRLELTYPGTSSLEFKDENSSFEVVMKIGKS
jgi:two-component system LytT family sensor kinase